MATANDLITRAFRRARVIGKDQVPTADEAADALAELNSLLDVWWNERLAVFHILQESFALVAGQPTRTIGATGQFVTTRPLELVDGCFTRRDSIDQTLAVLKDRSLYDGISVKSLAGRPKYVFYDATMTNGILYFWPTPDAADTVFLNSPSRLQSVAALVTSISLPPGYDNLVVNGLAVAIAPEYGVECPASVSRSLARTMRALKRTNSPSPVMGFDNALLPRNGQYNIYRGY